MIYPHQLIILVGSLLFITMVANAQQIKCWTDEDGVTSCGNVVPSEYTQKGYKELNSQAVEVNKVNKAPSQEEIALIKKKEKDEEQRKRQEAKDRELLELFSNEEDIERARQAILTTIDGQAHSVQTIVASLENNLKDLQTNLEESKKNSEVSASQLETIQKNIEDVRYRLKMNKDTLASKVKEKEGVNKEYDEYIKRFRDIKKRGLPLPSKPKEGAAAEQN